MSLVHYEVAYHLVYNPNKTHVIRLLTSDNEGSVEDYLRKEYGTGHVVLHYAMKEKEPIGREHTCGYCGCTRTVFENEPRPLHPAALDKSLWRLL